MVTRDELVTYLLHEMPDANRMAFAERWFSDPETREQLEAVEAELLDGYVRAQLSPGRRLQIERYLLDSEVQRRKLAFAAALHARTQETPHRHFPWVVASGVAAALVVVLAGTSLRALRQNRALRDEVTTLASARPIAATTAAGQIFSTSLTSNASRQPSERTTLQLPSSAIVVRLDLELREGEAQTAYSITVSTVGHVVWREGPLRPESRGAATVVTLWIPVGALGTGAYTLALETGGRAVRYYVFDVVREP